VAFTYLKVKFVKCRCLPPVVLVLVLRIWSCLHHWFDSTIINLMRGLLSEIIVIYCRFWRTKPQIRTFYSSLWRQWKMKKKTATDTSNN